LRCRNWIWKENWFWKRDQFDRILDWVNRKLVKNIKNKQQLPQKDPENENTNTLVAFANSKSPNWKPQASKISYRKPIISLYQGKSVNFHITKIAFGWLKEKNVKQQTENLIKSTSQFPNKNVQFPKNRVVSSNVLTPTVTKNSLYNHSNLKDKYSRWSI